MKGFTLVEILVVIGIFFTAIMIISGVIVLSGRTYQEVERKKELMQNGRVVLDSISREVRQSKKIVNFLPGEDFNSPSEIIFQDGHLEDVFESGFSQGGSGYNIILSSDSSRNNDFYKDAFIRISDGPIGVIGETRKIMGYDGSSQEALLEYPFENSESYFGWEYIIDTNYNYIRYHLEENFVKRSVYSYYFSGNPDINTPFNSVPPSGETMEVRVLEEPRIIGEHFKNIRFWGSKIISIYLELEIEGKEIRLFKKIFGRNL